MADRTMKRLGRKKYTKKALAQEAEKTHGKARSPQWRELRKAFLLLHPTCAVCGGTKLLEVHHKQPFHLKPELELDKDNLITLCENEHEGVNCHLLFGHLGSFKSFNVHVASDAATWVLKLKNRPS